MSILQFCCSFENADLSDYFSHLTSSHPRMLKFKQENESYFQDIISLDPDVIQSTLRQNEKSKIIPFERTQQFIDKISASSTHSKDNLTEVDLAENFALMESLAPIFWEFFTQNSIDGFFTFPSEKEISCPAGCESTFTTRLGFKYHIANFSHNLANLTTDILATSTFEQKFLFPIYFEKEDIEEYWAIKFFIQPFVSSGEIAVKKRREKKPKDPKKTLLHSDVRTSIDLENFRWISSESVFYPLTNTNNLNVQNITILPIENTQLMYKNQILHLSSNLVCSSYKNEYFLYFGQSFVVSKVIWIERSYLLIVVCPKNISLLDVPKTKSMIFLFCGTRKEIIFGFVFDFVILDCCFIGCEKSNCILGIAGSEKLSLFSFDVEKCTTNTNNSKLTNTANTKNSTANTTTNTANTKNITTANTTNNTANTKNSTVTQQMQNGILLLLI